MSAAEEEHFEELGDELLGAVEAEERAALSDIDTNHVPAPQGAAASAAPQVAAPHFVRLRCSGVCVGPPQANDEGWQGGLCVLGRGCEPRWE